MRMADAFYSRAGAPAAGATSEGSLLKRAVLVGLAMLVSGRATAGEMERPAITLSKVNWEAAAASLTDRGSERQRRPLPASMPSPSSDLPALKKAAYRCCCPSISSFRKDTADGKAEAATSDKYFGNFQPTKFFLPGAAGYDATFTIARTMHRPKPAIQADRDRDTGAAFVYALMAPIIRRKFRLQKELPHIARHPP